MSKPKRRDYSVDELYNPQIDLSRDGVAYGRQSSKDQVIKNVQSSISQTVMLLGYTRQELGFRDDGTTGKVTLFVENQVIDTAGNTSIKNASGTWPIDRRPGLKTICDLIESGAIGVVVAEYVDRLFRDEDRIDSNIFLKICKEHDCYVHISSKRMTYNFANTQHAEMFRMEVQMAAMWIESHVRGTMLRRRELAAASGQWAGFGSLPVNFIVDKRENSETFKKMIPYQPHADISVELYDRLIELGFDLDALCLELLHKPYLYPEFETWVYQGDYLIHSNLQKAPGGQGYHLTRRGLEHMLTNVVNIGAIKRRGKVTYNHHDRIIDDGRFWLVYDQLKLTRPDGSPTGKPDLKRYIQRKAREKRQQLLYPETNLEHGSVYFVRGGDSEACSYGLYVRSGLIHEYLLCVNADQLEAAVVGRMFEHLRTANLGDLKTARATRSAKIVKRLKELLREETTIEEELANLRANLKKLTIDVVVKDTEASIARILARKEEVLQEKEQLLKSAEDEALRTLEEELADLEVLWPKKPVPLKESILKVLIKRVILDQMSTKFFRVIVEWKYPEWGVEQTYLMQDDGGRHEWEEQELAMLHRIYPVETRKLAIMQALPHRSWRGIRAMASNKGLNDGSGQGKGRGRRFGKGLIESAELSWTDVCWLRKENLSFKSFSENAVGWTCSTYSVSTPADIAKLLTEIRILLKRDPQNHSIKNARNTCR